MAFDCLECCIIRGQSMLIILTGVLILETTANSMANAQVVKLG